MSIKHCASPTHSMSATSGSGINGYVIHPTRVWDAQAKERLALGKAWLPTHKCDLYGQTFATSEAAFAAMHERGYGVEYYPRSSVPLATFASLKHCRDEARFDALYRFLKHERRVNPAREHPTQRRELAELTKTVRWGHPVAKNLNYNNAKHKNTILL